MPNLTTERRVQLRRVLAILSAGRGELRIGWDACLDCQGTNHHPACGYVAGLALLPPDARMHVHSYDAADYELQVYLF